MNRRATTAPAALVKPSMDSLLMGSMFSNTAGRITAVSATHGIALSMQLKVKPNPSRNSSGCVVWCPEASSSDRSGVLGVSVMFSLSSLCASLRRAFPIEPPPAG